MQMCSRLTKPSRQLPCRFPIGTASMLALEKTKARHRVVLCCSSTKVWPVLGFDGFVGKCIAGWVGAWLASPVIGHWFEKVKLANIYLIPALVGAFAAAFAVAASGKALAKAFGMRETTFHVPEQRKAA